MGGGRDVRRLAAATPPASGALANWLPAYQPIGPLRVNRPAGEPGSADGGAAECADHAAHVALVIGGPAEGPEVVGQMLGREHLVGRLQRGAEIGDQGVDVEERAAALAFRALAAGDGGDVGASALPEDVESRRAVCVHQRAGSNMTIAERCCSLVGEAVDHAQDDRTPCSSEASLRSFS
jgi:hypothetical protein